MKAEKKVDNPGSVEERLARVETLIEQHEDRLRKLENHLSDIQRELIKHSAYLRLLTGITLTILGSMMGLWLNLILGG